MTTYCLSTASNTYITRLANGDWYNTDVENIIAAGSYTANFYERYAAQVEAEVENEARHEAAKEAVMRCHERNAGKIAQIRVERQVSLLALMTPAVEVIPF